MPEEIRPLAVYSVAQVAELLHSDRRRVWEAMDDGALKCFTPNGCKRGRRVLGQWVLDWMEESAASATAK